MYFLILFDAYYLETMSYNLLSIILHNNNNNTWFFLAIWYQHAFFYQFLCFPGESHGQRSLAGYSPWGCKESDMTEQLTHTHTHAWLQAELTILDK